MSSRSNNFSNHPTEVQVKTFYRQKKKILITECKNNVIKKKHTHTHKNAGCLKDA